VKADAARRNVDSAGLSSKITVITGDATDFDPSQHGITAAYVFLYPELLQKLSPKLSEIAIVASPYHPVSNLPMKKTGDVWIFRKED
jgi:hypothetical protein